MAYLAALPPYTPDLNALVRAEYLEMPGLCLTVAQAARLWNVGRDECRQTLDTLTRAGFLYQSKDQYVRSGCGRWFL
jgi:DNA-binding IclR family transcriptional regulator